MSTPLHRRNPRAAALLLTLLPALANAQRLDYLQHQSWSTDAGLPQSSVHQVLQSRDSYLWLATEAGVVRYDGITFKLFSHATDPSFTSDDISSLAEDPQGNLWFGTADGVIERTHGRTRHFGEADGLPSASVLTLSVTSQGKLTVATTLGAASFDGTRFQPSRTADADPGPSPHATAHAADGVEWSWDPHGVTARRLGRTLAWKSGSELPGSRVQVVLLDRHGVAWVGTNRGLVLLTSTGTRTQPVAALGAESILALTEDTEGNLWIGTETSGLHALRPRAFRTQTSLAAEEVRCLVQASDGTMWLGTREDGLRHLRTDAPGSPLPSVPNAALTSPIILSLAAGQHGDIWAGTPDGLNHVASDGTTTRYTSTNGLPDDLVRSLRVAQDGSLWIGTRAGLAHLHDGRFDTLTEADGLGGNLIGTLFQRPGQVDLWAATLVGLSRIQGSSITNFARPHGLTSNLVTGLATDSAGHLWAASRDQGLFLFDGQRFTNVHSPGLPEQIDGLLADTQGSLWLRNRQGVIRVSATELAHCADSRNQPCKLQLADFGLEDGMPSEEFVANGAPSAAQTRNGELWFATRKGVAITDPAAIARNLIPPPVVMERFSVDDQEITLDVAPTIPSGHTRYTFDFAALSLVAPSRVLYRYRLEGFDHDWSAETTRRSATYTNLPPGAYTFRVQAANNDGVWNHTGATLTFQIAPPVYRRWWFLLGSFLLLALLAAALYRLRLRRLQRSFDAVLAERNRIAREIHDTLAQDFVGVSLQLDLVSHLLAQQSVPEAVQQVKVTRSFVQSGIEQARQSIWNLRANTSAGSLPSRTSALAKTFASGSLTVTMKIGGAYRALPPELEQEVLRILQEALLNVQRHAKAGTVYVRLTYREDKLILTVQDDGLGLSPTHAGAAEGHFGLQGMHERASVIGATLEIHGESDQGTTLRLVVPIAEQKGARA